MANVKPAKSRMLMFDSTEPIIPMKDFTFGCDPEVFVVDKSGKAVSPVPFIPGSKEEPYKVEFGAIQRDGMAAEFNIDPANNFHDFNRNINAVMNQMKKFIPKDHNFAIVPHVVFDETIWASVPEDAKELGCSPDFNAWTGGVNTPPNPVIPSMRCAGGHVHIGWTNNAELDDPQHIMNCRDLVKQMDWFVGGWSVKQDNDPVRRTLYGTAGACRYKPYGVEYRTLSNFWLKTPESRLNMWNRMQQAIWQMGNMFLPERGAYMNDFLVESINTSKMQRKLSGLKFPFQTIDSQHNTYF